MPENKEQIYPTNITFNEGKVSYLQFNYDNKTYSAAIKDSHINFRDGRIHGCYDRETKTIAITLQHICGAQGFGHSYNDHCPACDSFTGRSGSFPARSLYQTVDHYCNTLEQLLKNNPLSVDKVDDEQKNRDHNLEFLAQHDRIPAK